MQTPAPRKNAPRLGCLTRTVLILFLGVVAIVAIDAVFAPWGFYMGDHFHVLPQWTGWGRMHSAAGDYLLYVNVIPAPSGSHTGPNAGAPHLKGTGALCTPRGQTFRMFIGADMEKHVGLDLNGKKIHFYMYSRPPGYFGYFSTDHRPSLGLYGNWHNSDILLDDHGSLSRAFLPDGTLAGDGQHGGRIPSTPLAPVQFALHEGTRAEFDSACAALKSH